MAKVLGFTIEIQGQQKVIDTTNQLKEALKQIKDEMGKTSDAKDYEKLAKEAAKLTNELTNVNKQQREYNKELQNSKNAAGSYNALNAELVKLRQSYKALSEEERNGIAGRDALTRIGQLDRQLKGIDASMGNFQRNVGNYPKEIMASISGIFPQVSGIVQAVGTLGSVGLSAINTITSGTSASISQASNSIDGLPSKMENVGVAAGRTGAMVAGAFAAMGAIVTIGTALFELNAKIDEAQADVMKTAGLTSEQVDRLTESLKGLDTKTTLEDLLNIGAALGQLGVVVNKDTIAAIDVLNVALGGELGNSAEEVATKIGTLRNLLVDMQTGDIANDYLRLGNVLNGLGATGAATADVVQDFASRIAGTGQALGLTTPQILGLSAAMQEANIGVERGGTGIKKVLTEIVRAPEAFAKTLNIPVADFKKLVETDLFGAFQLVIQKVKETSATKTDMIQTLDTLKISGEGEVEVFQKLSGSLDNVKKRVEESTDLVKGFNSVSGETAIKQETLGATASRVWNSISNSFVSSGIENLLKGILNLFDGIVKSIDYVWQNSGPIKAMYDYFSGSQTQISKDAQATADALEKQKQFAEEQAKIDERRKNMKLGGEGAGGETEEERKAREKREKDEAKRKKQEREKLQKDANNAIKKAEEDFQKEILALTKQIEDARVQIIEDSYQREMAAIDKSMLDKIDAYTKEADERLDINKQTEAKIIAAFGANSKQLADFKKQVDDEDKAFTQRRIELDLLLFEERNRLIAELDKKYADKAKADREKAFNERLQQTNKYYDDEIKLSGAKSDEAIAVLQNASADEQDAVEDNEKAKIAIRRKYDNLIRAEQIKQLETELAAEQARKFAIEKAYEQSGVKLEGGAPTADAVAAIGNIEKQISALRAKGVKTNEKYNKEEVAADKKLMDEKVKNAVAAMQVIQDFASQVGSFIDELNQRQIARMEEQITAHQDKLSQLQEEMTNTTGAQRVELQRQIDNEKAALAASTQQKADAEKEAAKTRQKFAIIQTIINTAMAVMNSWANSKFPVAAAIAAGLAGAAQIGIIAAQAFADGGKVLSGEKIRNKPNIRMRNGDNVLATVRTGEVILNERQQARLGGAKTFRRIGVPGFASGGMVGDVLPRPTEDFLQNATQSIQTNNEIKALVKAMDARFDRLQVHVVGEDVANELSNQARAKKAAVI